MPASLMIGPHFAMSALTASASAPGAEATTTTPMASSFCLVAGSASAATVSALSLLTISGGVLAGTNNPIPRGHVEAGHPGFRDGRQFRRDGDPLERGHGKSAHLPALTCGRLEARRLNITSTRPGMRSLNAGAAPR